MKLLIKILSLNFLLVTIFATPLYSQEELITAVWEPTNVASSFIWDENRKKFDRSYKNLYDDGYRVNSLTSYLSADGKELRFNATWFQSTADIIAIWDYKRVDFEQKYKEYYNIGYRLQTLNATEVSNQSEEHYNAIFIRSNENRIPIWNYKKSDFALENNKLKREGYVLIELNAFAVHGLAEERYNAIWAKRNETWTEIWNATKEEFERKKDEIYGQGYELTTLNTFRVTGKSETRFNAIWVKGGTDTKFIVNSNKDNFLAKFRQFGDQDYRLKMVDQSYLSKSCKPYTVRYNEVRQISSHNSYDKKGINPLADTEKPDLYKQADAGVRSFEIDIQVEDWSGRNVVGGGDWAVFHSTGDGDYCKRLSQCLGQLRQWHDDNKDHEVITVWLDLKDGWQKGGHKPVDLDNYRLEWDLGGLLYTPQDLLNYCSGSQTLQQAVEKCGWPTLESLRGKFIFVLMGSEERNLFDYLYDVNQYQGGKEIGNGDYHGNKICFVAPEIKRTDADETKNWPNIVFFNIHNINDGTIWATADNRWIAALALYKKKFISRGYRIDAQDHWDDARRNRLNHIVTEHVTQNVFTPKAVDGCGKPMQVIVSETR